MRNALQSRTVFKMPTTPAAIENSESQTRVRFPSPAPTSKNPNEINGFCEIRSFKRAEVRIKVRIMAIAIRTAYAPKSFVFSSFHAWTSLPEMGI